jgi:acyl-CoA thioesterase FadM
MSVHISDQTIKKEWIDYNNHMNMAYYVLVFDDVFNFKGLPVARVCLILS